jgi:predicted RNA binding protein YcfA (HicA-like mRNA interferase family)
MAKRISSEQFLKIIKAHDFNFISKSGSHAKYRNTQGKTVIVQHPRKDIPIGTLRSMIRQSGLPTELFD